MRSQWCDLRFAATPPGFAIAAALRYRTLEDKGMRSLFSSEDLDVEQLMTRSL